MRVLKIKMIMMLVFLFLLGCVSTSEKEIDVLAIAENTRDTHVVGDKATAISPNILYLLIMAEIAGQRNQYDVALESYLQVAKQVDDARIAERAAKIGLYLKDTNKTDEAVSLWLKRDDKNLTARKIAVLSALINTDKALALEHLSKILQQDPAGFEATLLELTEVLDKEGKADFVFSVLEALSLRRQELPTIYFVQALLAAQLNKWDMATEKINRVLSIQPEWHKARILKAQLSAQKGDFDLAQNVLESMLNENPKNDRIRKILAQVLKQRLTIFLLKAERYVKQKKHQQAFVLLTEALVQFPENRDLLYMRSLIAEKLNKLASLEADLKKIIEKNPQDSSALNALGYILADKTQRYDEAEVYLRKAITLRPDETLIIDSMGWLQFKKGNITEALALLRNAYSKLPESEIAAHLTEVLWAKGDKKEAKKIFSDSLKKAPDDELLLKLLKRFPQLNSQ